MPLTTLAVLGGSGVGTPELFNALLNWPTGIEARPELRVVLLGRSAHKLERVGMVSQHIVRDAYPTIHVEVTTDWRAGLEGADYILNQVRVGGLEARAHDETFPHAHGIPGEETIGPGGFANALRTIPAVLEVLQIVSDVAPKAVLLNLTNPAGIVQYAAMQYTDTHFISLCDSPITLCEKVIKLLDVQRVQVEITYLGMNHLGWIADIRDAEQSFMDLALAQIERLTFLGVDSEYIRATRAIPIPYVRYYLHPGRTLAMQQGEVPRARQLQALEQELLTDYEQTVSRTSSDVSSMVVRRGAVWYSAIVVPVLDALINDRGTTWVVNVANGQTIPWLSPETVIEVPARIDRTGAHALPVMAHLLAEELRSLLFSQAAYESLATSAIVELNRKKALRSLVAHPLVRSIEQAESVLSAVWPSGGVKSEHF
jgi:6-phospho-beta-glucosidase